MAAFTDADVSIDAAGAIRWTGALATPRHTVLEFIQWLMLKQDDEQAAGDDLLDITVETPFDRSTDQIMALNFPFNIDDAFAEHLYDGSVAQTANADNPDDELYSGLNIIGPVESGTEYMVLQDGKVLPAFWSTGINPEAAPSLVFSRHLIKSRTGGADIDGKRIIVLARTLGDQYRRFPATLGTGNSVAAIGNGADIFNTTPDATLGGFTDILNTEGFQDIDIDKVSNVEEYYSQWVKDTRSINDVYEYTKWISQNAHIADETTGAATGTDFIVNDLTIDATACSFVPLTDGTEFLTEVRVDMKIGLGVPTGFVHAELLASDDTAQPSAIPTGAVLARSENIPISRISSGYKEMIFRFNRINPIDGTFNTLLIDDPTEDEYFIVFRHDAGDASNTVEIDGAATNVDTTLNAATLATSTWTAITGDIDMTVKTSPDIHGIPGEQLQGINIEVGYDAEGGTGLAENNIAFWGTAITYDGLAGGTFQEGEYVQIVQVSDGTTVINGGKVHFDNGSTDMIIALETVPGGLLDNDIISSLDGVVTANIAGTPSDQLKGGGSGLVLAIDDNTGSGEVFLQVLDGVNPVDDSILYDFSQTTNQITATAVLNTRTVVPEYIGASTGSNIIGAYGIGFDPDDVGSSDRFIDLGNQSRVPPNNVIFTVSGLVSGEDRVLVGPRTGTALDRGQWLLATELALTGRVAVVVKSGTDTVAWPANEINWPDAGQSGDVSALRIELDSGIYRNVDYESHDGVDTFTILSTDFSGALSAAVDQNVFMAFIDILAAAGTATFTGVHDTVDRDLFVRVRDGGGTPIKTFESDSAQFLSTPQTIAAVRTPDA